MCLKKKNPEVAGYCLCSTVAFVLFHEISINGIPHLALCLGTQYTEQNSGLSGWPHLLFISLTKLSACVSQQV